MNIQTAPTTKYSLAGLSPKKVAASLGTVAGFQVPKSLLTLAQTAVSSTSVTSVTPLPDAAASSDDPAPLTDAQAERLVAVVGGVLLVAFAIRAGVGHYVGKRMGSKWGWFWGGVFGVPGMGGLALYRRGNRK